MDDAHCLVQGAFCRKLLPGKAASDKAEHERMNKEWLAGGRRVAPVTGRNYLAAPFSVPVTAAPDAPPMRQTISRSFCFQVWLLG